MEPIQITSAEAKRLHGNSKCIHVRTHPQTKKQYAHCIKFNASPGNRWNNAIGDGKAQIGMNPKTVRDNCLVLQSRPECPVHVITFDGGPVTLYHGRYVCTDPSNTSTCMMEFFDRGLADELEQETEETRRSKLEEDADTFFKNRGFEAIYEPCMFRWGQSRHYTPDFYIPRASCFVEIKGSLSPDGEAEPTQETLAKCKAVSQKGFAIVLVQGKCARDARLSLLGSLRGHSRGAGPMVVEQTKGYYLGRIDFYFFSHK